MFVTLNRVLKAEALADVNSIASRLAYRDGRATAGWHARTVKDNLQAVPSAALRQIQRRITDALRAHEVFAAFAQPARLLPPLFSRYGPGMAYGDHVDDALMGDPPLRCDLSVTVFLNGPEAYEGGDLVALTPAGEEAIKADAGDAVVYPSTTLHRVEPVTAGERHVAVTWVQSLVADAAVREVLFDLARAKRLAFAANGKDPLFDLVAKAHANLLRRHARP